MLETLRLYELRYNPDGALAGAYRYDDAQLIDACRADFEELYSMGEDFSSFHGRVTDPLLRARCAEASA
ncbi:DUF6879 family protein [Streptomyces sp. NPDC056244]|uniref:DUF6879 family protein n=1 Tax=Streptomyces sp. NPDC056244 TaxID=3345762 RepID=UPI0035E1B9B0